MQTTYTQDFIKGQAGQIADTSSRTVDSFVAESVIAFGIPVARGTSKEKQVIPFVGTGFVGISLFVHNEDGQYAIKESVSVLSKGRVHVDTLAVSVVAGETAYVVNATGAYTNVATSATAIGKFLTTGTGIQVLQLA